MHSNTRQAVRVDAFGLREMVLGKSRQAHQRTIMHSTLDRQRTIMHSNTRQALNASTRSVYAYAKWYWVNHGRLTSERQAHQRTQSLPSATHRHSSITPPAARALKRQASCLLRGLTSEQSCTRTLDRQRTIMHSNTRQALHASTRSVFVKWYWVNHGRLTSERQAHQRMQTSSKAYLPLPIVTHQSLDLLLERSSAKLLVFYASTRSRRAVEVIICMITRDFSVISIDVTGVSLSLSLSLSLLLTKVTHAQYRKRFRVSYNKVRIRP